MSSYVVIDRDAAKRSASVLRWVAGMLADKGPSWHRHSRDMQLAAAELEDAVEMSDARHRKVTQVA